MSVLDSFFVQLGFDINTEKIAEFRGQADALKKSVMEVGAVFIGAAAGLSLLVHGVAESMGELQDFAELNELSARSVAALGKIATENDSSMDGLKSTLQNLTRSAGEAALGIGRATIIFQKLGIAAKNGDGSVKKADQLLGEIADKMQKLSRQEQIGMAAKLGIDAPLVKLLSQGGENLAKLREEAELFNPFTDADYELAEKVDKLFTKAKNSVGVFAKIIGVSLLPIAREILTTYLDWFKASRAATSGLMVQGVQLFVAVLTTAWEWGRRVLFAIRDLIHWLGQFKIVVYAAVTALGVLISVQAYEAVVQLTGAIKLLVVSLLQFNAAAIFVPALLGAIAIAIALLIDDYANFREGNDSLIAELGAKFPIILDIIHALEAGVSAFVAFWTAEWEVLAGPVGDLGAAVWGLVRVVAAQLWPVLKFVFSGLAMLIVGLAPALAWLIEVFAVVLIGAVARAVNLLAGVFGFLTRHIDGVRNALVALALIFVPTIVRGTIALGQQALAWIALTARAAAHWVMVQLGAARAFVQMIAYNAVWLASSLASLATLAVSWVASFASMAVATLAATWPVLLIVAAIAAVVVAAWYLYKNWETITGAIGKAWDAVTDGIKNAFKSAIDYVMGLMDRAGQAAGDLLAKLPGAQLLAGALGVTLGAPAAPSPTAAPSSGWSPAASRAGVLGRADSGSSNSTATTSITNAPNYGPGSVVIQSPDPDRAGVAFREEMDRQNRQSMRNNQSAVDL